jgi:hypothetical protein
MIALDEDALICDFAETYHIYDIYQLPVEYIATLASGLRENSRIRTKVNGLKVGIDYLLLAHIADSSAINVWFQTEEGQKGQNRPPSMLKAIQGVKTEEPGFDSGEEFDKEWRKLRGE